MPLLAVVPLALALAVADGGEPDRLPAVEVTARGAPAAATAPVSAIAADAIDRVQAVHPEQLLRRVPGVWASRGSAQESLLAIRSPVLTGAGACGAFLLLDDGVPIRPAGFCNVNQLFDLDLELAARVEVLRGPGTAVHGSNGLHGVLNAVAHAPGDGARGLAVEVGPHEFARVFARLDSGARVRAWRVDAVAVDTGSARDEEGYAQAKLRAQATFEDAPGAPALSFAATRLDQETAGYVGGVDAYRDRRRHRNENPEAFRDARAARVQGRWMFALDGDRMLSLVPYARHDRMRFLQHFLPGQPVEENGSDSAGMQLGIRGGAAVRWQLGADIEAASGRLLEHQQGPVEGAPEFLRETRPVGRHYDYRVDARSGAAFAQGELDLGPDTTLAGGVRVETLRYDYDTRMAPGNLREDGSACGFGGCLYNRPADRDDRFTETAADLGLRRVLGGGHALRARVARAFRMPQASELYRLQRGQDVADLSPELLEGVELGWELVRDGTALTLDGYAYRKRNVILRDAQGLNVSDGRTRHRGLELSLRHRLARGWWLAADVSRASHRYAFDRAIAGGETIRNGDRIDSAPAWLGSARVGRDDARFGDIELEWVHQGGYPADAANTALHPGHDLLHLRWQRAVSQHWTLAARLTNLTDRRYAERADYAFGDWRYFPGQDRALFVTLRWDAARGTVSRAD